MNKNDRQGTALILKKEIGKDYRLGKNVKKIEGQKQRIFGSGLQG